MYRLIGDGGGVGGGGGWGEGKEQERRKDDGEVVIMKKIMKSGNNYLYAKTKYTIPFSFTYPIFVIACHLPSSACRPWHLTHLLQE